MKKNSYTYSHKTKTHEKYTQNVKKTCYNITRKTKKITTNILSALIS